MFEYVNLLIIEFLMMNLHVHDIYIYIYEHLMRYAQLMNYDMLLLNCDCIHDYKLWLLLIVVDNLISWFGYEL